MGWAAAAAGWPSSAEGSVGEGVDRVDAKQGGCHFVEGANAGGEGAVVHADDVAGGQDGIGVAVAGGIGAIAEGAAVGFAVAEEAQEFHLALEQLHSAGHADGLVEGRALLQGDGAGGVDAPRHKHVDELGAEVGAASSDQLISQHYGTSAHAHHVAIEEADVLGFIAFRDQGEEVEVGADAAAAGAEGLFTGHLHRSQV